MSRVMERANNIVIPSYMRREIGLSDDWQKNIPSKKKKMAVRVACKLESVLRRLSKN